MFKSASTSNFRPLSPVQPSYLALQSSLHGGKSPFKTKNKKRQVTFQMEKPPYQEQSIYQRQQIVTKQNQHTESPFKFERRPKSTKTWTTHLNPQDGGPSPLHESKNFRKLQNTLSQHNQKQGIESSYNSCLNTEFGFKKQTPVLRENLLSPNKSLSKTFNASKSMKALPTFNQDEQFTPKFKQGAKKQRKFEKFDAYKDLLKSSEQLIQRYKKIDDQKINLQRDFLTQVNSNAKSSKKIMLLEESSSRYQKQRSKSKTKCKSYKQIKNQISTTPSPPMAKYRPFQENFPIPVYSEYQIKVTVSPATNDNSTAQRQKKSIGGSSNGSRDLTHSYSTSNMLNKTFGGNSYSSFKVDNFSTSPNKYQTKTFTSGFGLKTGRQNRPKSTKRLTFEEKSQRKLSLDDFELGKCLGSGAFGQVFPARHKKTNMLVAVKKVKKESVKHMLDQFIQQIKIQLFLDHPNIVKLYTFFDDALHFYIVMEYMEGGSLYSYIKKHKTLCLEQTSEKLQQVCEGLKHMHENQVLHRDIKPENIVLSHNVAKLCDFGWSAICKDRRNTYCGTLDYVCPEIIEGDGYDDSVDIWCVGVLAYELMAGKTPFYNISRKQTMKKILDCRLQYPEKMPSMAVEFIKKVLKKNPDQRLSIERLLKEPLLNVTERQNSLL